MVRTCEFNRFIKKHILKIWRDTFGWRRFFMLDWWRCLFQMKGAVRFSTRSNSYTALVEYYKGVNYEPAWHWIDPQREKCAKHRRLNLKQ